MESRINLHHFIERQLGFEILHSISPFDKLSMHKMPSKASPASMTSVFEAFYKQRGNCSGSKFRGSRFTVKLMKIERFEDIKEARTCAVLLRLGDRGATNREL